MSFHAGQPQNLSEYMEQEGKKIAEEVERREVAPEAPEYEKEALRPVQPDLLEEGRRLLEGKVLPRPQKGYSKEKLQELLGDQKALDDFGVKNLPGRETQARDLVAALLQSEMYGFPESLHQDTEKELVKEERERLAFLESLRTRTDPEEEELARLRGEPGLTGEAPQAPQESFAGQAAQEQALVKKQTEEAGEPAQEAQPEEAERPAAETLKEKIAALQEQVIAASGREGSKEYKDLADQEARVGVALQRQREVFEKASETNNVKGMSIAAEDIERLEKGHGDLGQKIGALSPEQLPGQLEPLLHVKPEQQLSTEEYQAMINEIQSRKGPKSPTKTEQALLEEFQKREGERMRQEAAEQAKEGVKEVLQEKYEMLATMPKGEKHDKLALEGAKQAAELGDMRMAQDLLSRCDNQKLREAGLRDVAVTMAEKGIDNPELLKWVELGIRDKKFRSKTMMDIMQAKQRKAIEAMQEADPEAAEKLLKNLSAIEQNPTTEQLNAKWGGIKEALKSPAVRDIAKGAAIAAGFGAGAAAVAFILFILMPYLLTGALFAGMVLKGARR